jgi:hypothetical protein
MRSQPFQPRVLYRQTVLSPARWLVPPDLVAATRERARWPQALKGWQAGAIPAMPDVVVVEDGDRLLPLDLREDDDRELLRRYVGRGARSVTEQPGGPDAVQAVLAGPEGITSWSWSCPWSAATARALAADLLARTAPPGARA